MGNSEDTASELSLIKSQVLQVVIGVLINPSQEVLMTQRALSLHQGGLWEFPGGKVEQGETFEAAIKREFQEEISINIQLLTHLISITHHYPDKSVQLHTYLITQYDGEPKISDGQLDMKWVALSTWSNQDLPVPESNLEIIKLLNELVSSRNSS